MLVPEKPEKHDDRGPRWRGGSQVELPPDMRQKADDIFRGPGEPGPPLTADDFTNLSLGRGLTDGLQTLTFSSGSE